MISGVVGRGLAFWRAVRALLEVSEFFERYAVIPVSVAMLAFGLIVTWMQKWPLRNEVIYLLDLECLFYYNFRMADPRKKKSSRNGSQQINRYFHVLVSPLRLVNRTDPAAQENPPTNTHPGNALRSGRRSTDRDSFELYDKWLALSPRERQVTYLTCLGYKNEQIAFQMGVSAGTVKSYLKHVFLKMDVPSKTELRLKFHGFDFERYPP